MAHGLMFYTSWATAWNHTTVELMQRHCSIQLCCNRPHGPQFRRSGLTNSHFKYSRWKTKQKSTVDELPTGVSLWQNLTFNGKGYNTCISHTSIGLLFYALDSLCGGDWESRLCIVHKISEGGDSQAKVVVIHQWAIYAEIEKPFIWADFFLTQELQISSNLVL